MFVGACMRKSVVKSIGVCLFVTAIAFTQAAAQAAKQPAPMELKVGDTAPDFKLKYFDGKDLKDVSLSEYRGKKNVVLAFYVFAFTGG
jgi:peroxiredoxin